MEVKTKSDHLLALKGNILLNNNLYHFLYNLSDYVILIEQLFYYI